MTDFATERQDASDRRERDKDEMLLNVRARHLRQGLAEGVAPTLEGVARQMYPTLADEDVAKLVERASIPPDRGRTVSTIDTSIVKDLTRKFLEANREATAREAWQHVLQHGQPTFQESSFPAFVSGIRKELGITMGTGPRPKTEGEPLPSRPRPRRREEKARPAPSKNERAARLAKKRGPVEAPAGDGNGRKPKAAVARRVAVAPEPVLVPEIGNGKHLVVEMSLEVRKPDMHLKVDFNGNVANDLFAELMTRLVVGGRG